MSKAINDGGPAFPTHWPTATNKGATLRDYFAAKAMQARLTDYESCISISDHVKKKGVSFAEDVAAQAYDMADAMLKAREAATQES